MICSSADPVREPQPARKYFVTHPKFTPNCKMQVDRNAGSFCGYLTAHPRSVSPAKKNPPQSYKRNYRTMFPFRTAPPLRSTPQLLIKPRSRNPPRRPRGDLHPRAHRLQSHRADRRCVFACVHGGAAQFADESQAVWRQRGRPRLGLSRLGVYLRSCSR